MRNVKCYEQADISLDTGVTVVHGVNGSGKSTLLEAVFFALYGAKALDDGTLADVITIGADEAAVELWFTHDGADYHLVREIKRRDDRAITTKCVLSGPGEPIEGARDVRAAVSTVLRMDADAFVNCAYVRQGEVNKLIHASPAERQDMIDDLLQLGALEAYRDRASDARLGVKTVLDGQREVLGDVRGRIEEKEAEDLHEQLNDLETTRNDVVAKIDRFESQRDRAQTTLEEATDVLDRHEEIREDIEELDAEIERLRGKIQETERERETVTDEIRERKSEREALATERTECLETVDIDADDHTEGSDAESSPVEERIDELETRDESLRDDLEAVRLEIERAQDEIDRHEEAVESLEAEATSFRERATELEETLDADREAIQTREDDLADLESDIESLRERFEDAPIEFGEAADLQEELQGELDELLEEIGDVRASQRTVESEIEEGERLLEAGKCPECAQPVDDSPHVDVLGAKRERLAELESSLSSLESDRDQLETRIERAESLREAERNVERLAENRASMEQLLEEKRTAAAERRDRREELLERATAKDEAVEERRDAITECESTIEGARERLGEINGERRDVGERLEALRRVAEIDDERDRLESAIETRRERLSDWETMNDERREQLSTTREQKRELEETFDDERVSTAREEKRRAEEYIEAVDPKLTELADRRDELQGAIGSVEEKIDDLERLCDRRDELEERCESLESLYDEAETLQATYGNLRTELRRQNVETLERLLNETFELIYRNDAYAGIDLDGEYRLTVYQKDGEPLDPEQLSGGERALFNLSLRCAIYRLLAEGVEGAAPMPPLILDEPTVFLDAGHVSQLVTLVDSMRELGVEQIVLVSHDEELVSAADALVHVEKDPTSNRSTIGHRDAVDATMALVE